MIANQPESRERAEFLLSHGRRGLGSNRWGICHQCHERPDRAHQYAPRLRNRARSRRPRRLGGEVAGRLFDYQAAQIGFTSAEKRLLFSALAGPTDEELARILSISLPTVKKTWLSIYNRVEDHIPDLIAVLEPTALTNGRRGREKRRGVLAYLRNHPEELRPTSGKW